MSDKATFRLVHRGARTAAVAAVNLAPHGYVVVVQPPTRTLEQNSRLHAMLTAIAKSGFEWGGRVRDLDELKALFVSGWRRATHQEEETVPGFDGEPVQLRKSTAAMTVPELTELMDYIEFYCGSHEINIADGAASNASKVRHSND